MALHRDEYENKLILVCHTDGDWGFDLETLSDKQIEEIKEIWKKETAPFYYEYIPDMTNRLVDNYTDYCFNYDFSDIGYCLAVKVLKTLQVMLYADTHDWAYKQVGDMLQSGIDFVKSEQEGVHYATVQDQNWQPTSLIIIRKRLENNE